MIKDATNALLPSLKAKVSVRIPPTLSAEKGRQILIDQLTKNIPHNATIVFNKEHDSKSRDGFSAPEYGQELI